MPESVRLFNICQGMNWAVLPVDGGLYDQDPKLLDQWGVLFREQAIYEDEKQKQAEAKAKREAKRR